VAFIGEELLNSRGRQAGDTKGETKESDDLSPGGILLRAAAIRGERVGGLKRGRSKTKPEDVSGPPRRSTMSLWGERRVI